MDTDQNPSSNPKRPKWLPKPPQPRKLKQVKPKREEEEIDNEDEKGLLKRFKDHLGKQRFKAEKKCAASVQVAFGNGVESSGRIRSFGVSRQDNSTTPNSSDSELKTFANEGNIISSSPATAVQDGTSSSVNVVDTSCKKKEYKEPWNYNHSYYPVTLPWRTPYSGDPELLDEKEFGEDVLDLEYHENTVNPALELGLLDESEKPQMLFLQLPTSILHQKRPQEKRSATTDQKQKGQEKAGEHKSTRKEFGPNQGRSLERLPEGHMGKLLVYKSGAVKWRIGEVIYDVAPGVRCDFAQDVVTLNTAEKHVCTLGEVYKRAVVTPDIDSLVNLNLD